MRIRGVTLLMAAVCPGARLSARNPAELTVPGWCGPGASVTVFEAGFHPSGRSLRQYNEGTADQFARRTDEALAHYRKAVQLEPRFTAAQNNLGTILMQQREPDAAIGFLTAALETDPVCASLYTNLAMALILTGRTAEGREAAQRAAFLNPVDP